MTVEDVEHVVGPEALKGLAHPLRLELLAALDERGSATASQLAADLGESSGATSYHLRQLFRHGFVEEDADHGTARERYWIPRRGGWSLPAFELADDPRNAVAVDIVLQAAMQQDQRRLLQTMVNARTWPQEWRDAARRHDVHVTLNADQTQRMLTELDGILARYKALAAGPGARRVSVVLTSAPTEHESRPAPSPRSKQARRTKSTGAQ